MFLRGLGLRIVLGVEVPAKQKHADQGGHEKREADSQPDVPPKNRQIEHGRKHRGDERKESGQRRYHHFHHDDTVLHIRMNFWVTIWPFSPRNLYEKP
jgi:hypothetical protein